MNSLDANYELLLAAKNAIEVADRLMAQMNESSGCQSAPGPVWGPAYERLKAAVANLK